MKNQKRFNKALDILAKRLTREEYNYVSTGLTLLWGGVTFNTDNVLDFMVDVERAYEKNKRMRKQALKNKIVKFKVMNGGK